MEEGFKLTKLQRSILKEVGSICTGNAMTALSQLLKKRIELEMPHLKIVTLNRIPTVIGELVRPTIGIRIQILGAFRGNALLIFPEKSAFSLLDLFVEEQLGKTGALTELGISALKEIGTIVISSYLGALSALTGMVVFPSPPDLADGTTEAIANLAFAKFDRKQTKVILIETIFKEEMKKIEGNFFLALDSKSMRAILKSAEEQISSKKRPG